MPDGSNRLQGALQAKRRPGRPRSLRTAANAEIICSMLEQGYGLIAIARHIGYSSHTAILEWVRDDKEKNGGRGLADRYARAQEARWTAVAEGLLDLAARDCTVDGRPDNALVQQLRLEVDTRKWLLSKMVPRQFGDRIEVAGDADAPLVTRIELVAVHPQLPSRVIDNDEAMPSEGTHKPQKR